MGIRLTHTCHTNHIYRVQYLKNNHKFILIKRTTRKRCNVKTNAINEFKVGRKYFGGWVEKNHDV